jgi:pectate lyase
MKLFHQSILLVFVCMGCCMAVEAQTYDFPTATQNIVSFPTAEGFGKFATGGRGGKVVTVTTLADDAVTPPEGSLRWALSQYPDEPITVVFNVSGWIILHDILRITRTAGVTIAGQTAPGEGVTLYPRMFSINGSSNIVVRNVRFRTGSHGWDGADLIKGATLVDQALCAENTQNIIFDHCVFGWSAEEIVNNQCSHFNTFSYCLLHEGLYDAGHHKGSSRSFACQWGGSQSTFHHNMLAHNNSRSPRFQGARDQDFIVYDEYINNVNYNWGRQGSCYGGENSSTSSRYNGHQVNFCNNYYRYGPATKYRVSSPYFASPTAGTRVSEWYFNGNYMDGFPEITADNKKGVQISSADKIVLIDTFIVPAKFLPEYKFDWSAYTMKNKMQTADDAYQTVLDKVGCIVRDSIERRIIKECKNGTCTFGGDWGGTTPYGIIDDPDNAEVTLNADSTTTCRVALPGESRAANWDSDGDGMPDEWEKANGFDPSNAGDGNYINPEGYTALEKYLDGLMGENISGTFAAPTSVRTLHAVQFGYSVADGKLAVTSADDVTEIHLFDTLGRCRLLQKAQPGVTCVDITPLSKGVYILWVTDSKGYRNAVKIKLQ